MHRVRKPCDAGPFFPCREVTSSKLGCALLKQEWMSTIPEPSSEDNRCISPFVT
jgi:hypothetical protein